MPHGSVLASIRTSVVGASIGLIGGIWLQYVHKDLLPVTPLLLALPVLGAMSGDLASIITAHLSDPETSPEARRKLYLTLLLVVPINTLGVAGLSLFLAWLQDFELTRVFIYRYSALIFAIFALVVLVTLLGSLLLNKSLEQKRINGDDILIPAANIVASVVVLLSISFAVWRIF